jgi:DNA-binding FadR family transcriptional regulator
MGKKMDTVDLPDSIQDASSILSSPIRAGQSIRLGKIPKTGELIARELRKRIVHGELKEGESLPAEVELMAQLGVSRASLREALRILESECLITVRRGSRGGPVIHRPDSGLAASYFGLILQLEGATLEDLYEARMLIEPPAVRMVVRKFKGRAPESLLSIMRMEQEAIDKSDMASSGAQIARFHDALIELADNKTLLLLMKILNLIYEQHIATINAGEPAFDPAKAAKLSLKAQAHLIELLKAGDESAAVTYWRMHLAKVREYLFTTESVKMLIDVV